MAINTHYRNQTSKLLGLGAFNILSTVMLKIFLLIFEKSYPDLAILRKIIRNNAITVSRSSSKHPTILIAKQSREIC